MSLENIQKIKQGVNTANLLNHLETEIEPPKQFGLRFRFQGVIDKIVQQLKTLNTAVYGHHQDNRSNDATSFLSLDNKYYDSVLSWGPDFNWLGMFKAFKNLFVQKVHFLEFCQHLRNAILNKSFFYITPITITIATITPTAAFNK